MSKQLDNWLKIRELVEMIRECEEPLKTQYLREVDPMIKAYEHFYKTKFDYNKYEER